MRDLRELLAAYCQRKATLAQLRADSCRDLYPPRSIAAQAGELQAALAQLWRACREAVSP